MVTHKELEFLQGDFLTQEFLKSHGATVPGFQFNVRTLEAVPAQYRAQINTEAIAGLEFRAQVAGSGAAGLQYNAQVSLQDLIGQQYVAQVAGKSALGSQALVQITSPEAPGAQFEGQVAGIESLGVQFEGQTQGLEAPAGMQAEAQVAGTGYMGGQFEIAIDSATARGFQYWAKIQDLMKTAAIQYEAGVALQGGTPGEFRVGAVRHICGYPVFASDDWLTGPFLAAQCSAGGPMQFLVETTAGTRFIGSQVLAEIASSRTLGGQFQTQIDASEILGGQFLSTTPQGIGMQWRVSLYNTNRLRILCDFASRGTTGTNWTTNSQAAGDFDVNNLNTDVVEQVYRSAGVTGIQIVCDTEVSQGTFLDTLAILNHNMTTSANVIIEGSNDPGFSTSDSFSLSQAPGNTYYIAPALPTSSYRYWRISIDDSTNPDGFIQIGAILFGSATIFSGECFSNPIRIQRQNFSQGVMTEGYTTVSNDRGIKRRVSLDFRNIDFGGGNYTNLVNIFENRRTTHKCLWIPDPRYPSRYAIFGKLTEIPEEEHEDNGEDSDYVSFSINIDEAK